MAYKKRLSKRKNWTGKELGQLAIANYAYMYENQLNEEDADTPKTLFDLKTFEELLEDLWRKNEQEGYAYQYYSGIERWLGKYSNVMWGYNGTLDMCIETIDGRLAESYMLAVMEYSKDKAAAAGLKEVEELLAATPKEAGAWYNEDTTRQRLNNIHETTNGFMWIALDCYYKIKTFNKALEIIAGKYEVPEVTAFSIVLSDREEDLERLKQSAENLEALRQRLAIKDLEEPLQGIIFDITNITNYAKDKGYTEESIEKTEALLDAEDGFTAFYGGALMNTLFIDPLAFMGKGRKL